MPDGQAASAAFENPKIASAVSSGGRWAHGLCLAPGLQDRIDRQEPPLPLDISELSLSATGLGADIIICAINCTMLNFFVISHKQK
jgi:hypothetical protein